MTGAIYTRAIPEHPGAGRLGRHVAHDPRSLDYQAELAPLIRDVSHVAHGLPLDQGDAGACTAFATCGAQNADPRYPLHAVAPFTSTDALTLYTRETADEGQPWPQYDPGGSGLAVCKAARELGWLTRYAHTFDLDSALRALVMRPVIAGMNWYDSFDSPDGNGLIAISADAQVRGGHEVCAVGIDTTAQLVTFWNSWGPGYGLGGQFAMGYGTLERLLAEEGDVTVPGAAVAR
jgi:hypothetical protein